MNRLKVQGTLLADWLEDRRSLVCLNLLIPVEVDNEPGNVLNDASDGDDVALFILQHGSNLGSSDVQSPQPLPVSLDETRDGLQNIRICHLKIVNEVDEDVVAVSAHDFQWIENGGDEAIGFRDEIFGH